MWIHSVPQEIVNSVSDTEKKRQEAINEVIYTERDFVRDMEYLREVCLSSLVRNLVLTRRHRPGSTVSRTPTLFHNPDGPIFSSKSFGTFTTSSPSTLGYGTRSTRGKSRMPWWRRLVTSCSMLCHILGRSCRTAPINCMASMSLRRRRARIPRLRRLSRCVFLTLPDGRVVADHDGCRPRRGCPSLVNWN